MILRKWNHDHQKRQEDADIYHIRSVLTPSAQMYPLIGVNLLRLLSQNRLSDFHTALEIIDSDQLQTNPFIKQAVDLGQ